MRDCQACICLKCKHNIDLYYCEISHEHTCKGCEDYMGECADYNLPLYGAKLCPFCAGEATMRPEGDYWEITCDDCGVFKQGNTYEQALNEWNLRRL